MYVQQYRYIITYIHDTAVVVGAVGEVDGSRSAVQLGEVILLPATHSIQPFLTMRKGTVAKDVVQYFFPFF